MMTTALHAMTYRTIESPFGPMTLAGSGSTLMRLVIAGQRREPDCSDWHHADEQAFPDVAAQLCAYFGGETTEFDVELCLVGTDFQHRVWAAVQSIPYGQTRSYAQIAEQVGSPRASRAVGFAVGRNPVPIIVPCHRVVGAAGRLTGYVGGIDRKKALLRLEAGVSGFTSKCT